MIFRRNLCFLTTLCCNRRSTDEVNRISKYPKSWFLCSLCFKLLLLLTNYCEKKLKKLYFLHFFTKKHNFSSVQNCNKYLFWLIWNKVFVPLGHTDVIFCKKCKKHLFTRWIPQRYKTSISLKIQWAFFEHGSLLYGSELVKRLVLINFANRNS